MLAAGMETSGGLPVASGLCRFYQPGTLTPVTVYADSAAAGAITPPLVLTAGGTGIAYTQQPTRMIVKDALDLTTLFDGNVNTNRAESEYIQSAAFNGGAETRLQTVLDAWTTAFGGSTGLWTYRPYSDAVDRNIKDAIAEIQVSVKTYGAVGDGVADDTAAIQATVARVIANGGGIVYLPPGTYLISSVITVASRGVTVAGAGPLSSILKQSGVSSGGVTFTASVATFDIIQGRVTSLQITASTTSTGTAITGAQLMVDNVYVVAQKFRTAVAPNGSGTFWLLKDCALNGNDSDTSSIAVSITSIGTTIVNCIIQHAGANQAVVQVGATVCSLLGNYIVTSTSTADAVKVLAGGNISVMSGNQMSGGSAAHGLSVSSTGSAPSATGNAISPDILDSRTASTAAVGYSLSGSSAVTPLPLSAESIRIIATAAITVTVNAIAATGFAKKWSLICSNASGGAVTWTFNAQYVLSAAVAPATGNRVNLLLEYNPIDSKVYEIGRAATAN